MATTDRIKAKRDRQQHDGTRVSRVIVPETRADMIRRQVAGLSPSAEREALDWAEAVADET